MAGAFETILRPEDFLYCQLEFVNLRLVTPAAGGPRLVRSNDGPAFIVVRLPPQHFAEEAVGSAATFRLPLRGTPSAPSRLAFRLPSSFTGVDYRVDTLLGQIATAELVGSGPVPTAEPATVIEYPDRLLLVPAGGTHLSHRTSPGTSAATGATELWHTELGAQRPTTPLLLKAIGNPNDADRPFGTLTSSERHQIVLQSQRDPAQPWVIEAALLRLSALGATATVKSIWPAKDATLAAWEHQSAAGRDYYVYTLTRGFLFPFGHPATIAKVFERKIQSSPAGQAAATLMKPPEVLNILEAERSFLDDAQKAAYPHEGREMPFASIRIASAPREIDDRTEPIPVDIVLTDRPGNRINATAHVFFVEMGDSAIDDIKRRYETTLVTAPNGQRSPMARMALQGQLLAIADNGGGRGDTNLNVDQLTFTVHAPATFAREQTAGFLPLMRSAEARFPGLEQMVGTTTEARTRRPIPLELAPIYLSTGFADANRQQIFAQFAPIDGITIPADRAGGLAAPTFPKINALSRLTGPMSAPAGSHGTLNPIDLVGETTLLGTIKLKDIIEAISDGGLDTLTLEGASELFRKVDDDGGALTFVPRPVMTTISGSEGLETRFIWKPRLKTGDTDSVLKPADSGVMQLILKGRILQRASGASEPSFAVSGKLRHFKLSLLNLVSVGFKRVEFKSEAKRKVDINLDIDGVEFHGALQFVQKLQEALPLQSMGFAPRIQTLPDGIVVSYAIPLPALTIGVFSFQNMALSASVSLFFKGGKPAVVRFALSERSHPFQIGVSIFGGTGFFALALATDGNLMVEAALEFGVAAAIDFAVVKGGVYAYVGVYISMRSVDGPLVEGHLRLGGFVEVLEIISVSIEVFIGLRYEPSQNALIGRGRLTVGVHVAFFSESFSFEVEKKIAAFDGRSQVMALAFASDVDTPRDPERSAALWIKYCEAFR